MSACRTAAGDLARSLLFQPLHGLFHFGCELEHHADSFGRLLAFAEGGELVEDFGPLGRVPAQRFGRQELPPFWLVRTSPSRRSILKGVSKLSAVGLFSYTVYEKDVRPTELETGVALLKLLVKYFN